MGARSTKAERLIPATRGDGAASELVGRRRSTKAERLIPATPADGGAVFAILEGRSTKAERLIPATRASKALQRGSAIRRSTKAERLIPATPEVPRDERWYHYALNEGREVNPGDTPRCRSRGAVRRKPLNEGREVNPGDTRGEVDANGSTPNAQRRPRG